MLLGVSGSVAAIKVPIIAQLLSEFCEVIVIATDASRKLLAVEQLHAMGLPVKGMRTPCSVKSNAQPVLTFMEPLILCENLLPEEADAIVAAMAEVDYTLSPFPSRLATLTQVLSGENVTCRG